MTPVTRENARRRPATVAVVIAAGAAVVTAAAVIGYRWYSSPEQALQRHLAEVEALPGVAQANAHGDSPWRPQLHVTLEDDVTAEQIAHVGAFAEDAVYHSMSAELGTATLDPIDQWPDAESIDTLLYAAALDLPAATPSTRVSTSSQLELHYPADRDALGAATEAAAFLAGLPDDAPPAVTSFEVRPDRLSHHRISMTRDLVHQDTEIAQAVLTTVEPLREDLVALELGLADTLLELGPDHDPSDDEVLGYRTEVQDVVAALPDHVDLPEDYRVRASVTYGEQVASDSFEAYPGTPAS